MNSHTHGELQGRVGSLHRWAGLAVLLWAVGCSTAPYKTELHLEGSARLNPTIDSQPSAVNIRIFELIDREAFDQAQLGDLLALPPGLPDTSWVQPLVESTVYVGRRQPLIIEIKTDDVRFLGIVGVFNERTSESRIVLELDGLDEVLLQFDGHRISRTQLSTAPPPQSSVPTSKEDSVAEEEPGEGAAEGAAEGADPAGEGESAADGSPGDDPADQGAEGDDASGEDSPEDSSSMSVARR